MSNQEQTVITLDNQNTVQLLIKYVELAQQKGAFVLNEAELLKRASDVLLNNVPDNELNAVNSRHILIQGVQKGQKHGAYTLNDAALLSKVVQYVISSLENATTSQSTPTQAQLDDDLTDLAEPIPLRPKEV